MIKLPEEFVALIAKGVSCIVGSRDAQLRPSLMRAVGSRIDGGGITVFVARSHSRQLLQDIAATGHVAAVFSEPTTHRTVQLKATRAQMRNATAADQPDLARCMDCLEKELQAIGYASGLAGNLLAHRLEDIVAVTFEPEQGVVILRSSQDVVATAAGNRENGQGIQLGRLHDRTIREFDALDAILRRGEITGDRDALVGSSQINPEITAGVAGKNDFFAVAIAQIQRVRIVYAAAIADEIAPIAAKELIDI